MSDFGTQDILVKLVSTFNWQSVPEQSASPLLIGSGKVTKKIVFKQLKIYVRSRIRSKTPISFQGWT